MPSNNGLQQTPLRGAAEAKHVRRTSNQLSGTARHSQWTSSDRPRFSRAP